MSEVTVPAKNIGGSIAVFIPAEIARLEGIVAGKLVHLTVHAVRRRAEVLGRHRGIGSFERAREDLWGDW